MRQIAFDMETSDPDDALTLCILATHPKVDLTAVTVTPGSREQVGVVRHLLTRLGRSTVPVGAFKVEYDNPKHVSEFHRTWLGNIPPSNADGEGRLILEKVFQRYPDTTLLTGGPLKNPGTLLKEHSTLRISRWVAQGGFAGDSVVPEEHRLAKFTGRETCPTFNFNGAPQFALNLLASERVGERWLVSKNVCHGVVYDEAFHTSVSALPHLTSGMQLVHEAMTLYLRNRPAGKAFHDPLAAAVAIDPSVCVFREVEVYRAKGDWGARLATGTRTHISIAINRSRFFDILTEAP